MTRYGDDDRDAYDDTLQPNADCQDCGIAYSKADDDPSGCCDPCSDKRDRWATALELRLMAKAVLRADPATIKDVA
jgi:hypothetical protein